MPLHVEDDLPIQWAKPDFANRKMRSVSGEVYATWYGPNGWRNDIQIVPAVENLGDDVQRYARSAAGELGRLVQTK